MAGETAAPWGKSWESSRGAWTTDYNNSLTLIRASVDDVIHALADRTEHWERDVLGGDIVLGQHGGAFVFRLRGHTWTEAVLEFCKPVCALPEVMLSRQLNTRVIDYSVSDTSGCIGYSLYENGELLEDLSYVEGGPVEGANTFSSRLRDLKLDDITDVWGFSHKFLVDQDAFDPGIDFGYFLDRWRQCVPPDDRHRVVNPGFTFMMPNGSVVSVPPIERIDYLALVKPPYT
jgi:hypothetical protein